jgi:hypothetical protein
MTENLEITLGDPAVITRPHCAREYHHLIYWPQRVSSRHSPADAHLGLCMDSRYPNVLQRADRSVYWLRGCSHDMGWHTLNVGRGDCEKSSEWAGAASDFWMHDCVYFLVDILFLLDGREDSCDDDGFGRCEGTGYGCS